MTCVDKGNRIINSSSGFTSDVLGTKMFESLCRMSDNSFTLFVVIIFNNRVV